jgi:transcriptional regulator with XRE-family HTH domain
MSKYDDPDAAYDREIEVEALAMRLADVIQESIEARDMSRADLARAMGVSKAHITQTLSGQRNLTLKTVAEALHALDSRLEVAAVPLARAAAETRQAAPALCAHEAGAALRNVIDMQTERVRRGYAELWWQHRAQGGVAEPAADGVPVMEVIAEGALLAQANA